MQFPNGPKQQPAVDTGASGNNRYCTHRLVLASVVFGAVLLLIPFAIVEIVLGAQFWSSCPVERLLPIYLVFSGSIGVLLCLLCAVNFMLMFGYCQTACCVRFKEHRVGLVICLVIFNCMWLTCGFSMTYKASGLHTSDASSLYSTLPSDRYLYCDDNLLGFTKAAIFVRLAFLVGLILIKRLMYFDYVNLTQTRPIALN